jgi:hypothetical protein
VGEREQVLAFMDVEPQRVRYRTEHAAGGVNVSPLLEPRVPGQPDVGELRDLLAP